MSEQPIEITGVGKRFRLYHDRPTSLKDRFVNLRKPRWEEFWALRDVTCEIDRSETVGLIGPNGSGKSTLLKMVAGIIRPTEGTITTRGRIASLLELGAGFHPDLTGRENVFMNASILGLSRHETEARFDEIVAFSELDDFIDTQVRHFSSGMYVRLGFAVAVHVDPEILIIDEVLAVGDEPFQRKCIDRIRRFQREGRTIVFVTHTVDLVREICNRGLFLHKGRVVAEGEPADVIRSYRDTVHGEAHLDVVEGTERGTGEVRIAEVKILDADGVQRQVFAPGESLEFSVLLSAERPVDDPHVGVTIYDERGVGVYGTNTVIRGMSLGRLDGKCRVRFRVPSLPVLNGTFHVTVGVHSRDERIAYHWREKAWAFRVVSAGPDAGTTHFDARVEIEMV